MRYYKFFYLIIALFLLNLSIAYSVDSCCYTGSTIVPSIGPNCPPINPINIRIGDLPASGSCSSFTAQRSTCIEVSTGNCIDNVAGNIIFNLPAPSPLSSLYSTCQSGTIGTCTIGSGGAGIGGGIGGSSGGNGNGNQTTLPDPTNTTIPPTQIKNLSSCFNGGVGGTFGFFLNKTTCEQTKDSGNKFCLYNPNLAGLLSSYSGFQNLKPLNLPSIEDSCISKTLIKTCSDYKTLNNCNNNRASISDSCNWIASSNFLPTSLNKKSGICVSNYISTTKYFNKDKYGVGSNLIKNPSFENNINFWGNAISTNRISSQNSFDLNNYYILNSNSISQNISNVKFGSSYLSSFYILYNTSFQLSNLKVKFNSYDLVNNLINSTNMVLSYGSNSLLLNGTFVRVNLNNYITSNNTKKIEIILNTLNGNLGIDAISFEKEQSIVGPTTIQNIFKPVEIIPSVASNCNLCFEDLNFNTCTKQKSNLSGDCSYMVTGNNEPYDFSNILSLSNYFGKNTNLQMYSKSNLGTIDNNLKWKSQSIQNSKLFCGLYLSQTQCTDSNNYINKNFQNLNPFSGSSLCKWSVGNGCYKDSNNDNYQDTFTKNPPSIDTNSPQNFRQYKKLVNPLISQFDKYTFKKDCDSIPPTSYIYLTGRNQSGSQITITSNYVGIIGNLKINYDISDMSLESCSGYNISKSLILDININDNLLAKTYLSSQIKNSFLFKDFFSNVLQYVDLTGVKKDLNNDLSKIFNTNSNNISIIAIDQSGNLAKEFKFKFDNLDLLGPSIILNSHSSNLVSGINQIIPLGPYGKNSIFNFTINDSTNFNCNLNLNPILTTVPFDFYNSSYSFNNSDLINNQFNFNLSEFIFNTTNSGNMYNLTFSCSDIFNQRTIKSYKFLADLDTSLVILNPLVYTGNSTSITGYLNGKTKFNAVSSSFHVGICNFINFADLNSSSVTNVNYFSTGFNISGFPSTKFYTNISGNLSFSSDGLKVGKIKCSDNSIPGNFYIKNLNYLYDTKNPILINYSIENILRVDNTNTTYFNGSNYFTILSGNEVKLNLIFNGTGSWVKDFNLFNFSALNSTGIINEARNLNIHASLININDSNYLSTIKLSNFEPSLIIYGDGIQTFEKNLFMKKFSFNFTDSANNSNSTLIQYYSDLSVPSFNFSGDIISQNDNLNIIFTKSLNPKINIKFNSPNYRKFACRVDLRLNPTTSFTNNYPLTNNLSFNLKNFTNINLKSSSVNFNFNCKDVYGKPLIKSYLLKYDNQSPILDSINLNGETPKFIRIYPGNNQNFNDYTDKLVFSLQDTSEVSYNCFYNISESSNPKVYVCNTSNQNILFTNAGPQLTNTLNLLSGNSSGNICIRNLLPSGNDPFNNAKSLSISTNNSLNTTLKVSGYCTDNVGLSSQVKNLEIPIIYSPKDLISLNFKTQGNISYAIIVSYFPFSNIKLSNSNSIPPGALFETITNKIGPSSGLYTYTSINGIDTSNFTEGNSIIYAIASDGSFVSGNLLVDRTIPTVSMLIPDNFLGNVYSKNFWINLNASDLGVGLKKVELLVNNNLVFTFNGSNVTYTNSSINLSNVVNYFSNINKNYNNKIEFINAIINNTYDIEFRVFDASGNKNSVFSNVTIKEGIGINLENSQNSIVGIDEISWLTKNNKPIIKFRTSKIVDKCTIYPMVEIGFNEPSPFSKKLFTLNSNQFNFDLSAVVGFDLNKLSDKIDTVRIDCNIGANHYLYNRDLSLINFIPDYVINSSQGFILNEAPYKTNISLKSVGPFKDISCSYSIDNSIYTSFGSGIAKSFTQEIDFTNYGSGIHNLNIKCSDLLNTRGPIKTYPFSISKNAPLSINSLKLINSNNYISLPKNNGIENIIYVNNLNNLKLEFNLNKKSGVTCTYRTPDTGILGIPLNFIKNLFGIGQKTIPIGNSPYLFNINNLQVSDNAQLEITCSKSGNLDLIKSYRVKLLNTKTNAVNSWI